MSNKYKEIKRCIKLFDELFVYLIKFVSIREYFKKKGLEREWNEAVDVCTVRYAKAFGVNVDDFKKITDELKF